MKKITYQSGYVPIFQLGIVNTWQPNLTPNTDPSDPHSLSTVSLNELSTRDGNDSTSSSDSNDTNLTTNSETNANHNAIIFMNIQNLVLKTKTGKI